MSFGNPDNPYGQQPPPAPYGTPQQPAPYGYPQQAAPGYGFPQQPVPGHAFPQQPVMPAGPGAYASWGARFGATLIDFLIAVLVPIIIVALSMLLRHTWGSDCAYLDIECTNAAKREIVPFIFVLWALAFLWFVAAHLVILVKEGKGASPGKKAMKIRLIREETGQPLGFGMALLRRICHGLDGAACNIGYLWPAWDAKGQTFADKVMRTVVVSTK
ncbi:RDD family protein [Streptomyces platensis]|uniref:RDD family protein n=1 Tax=Streptomyces platensis TaxID=58346 RepID=UPI002E81E036|nr:RDD family protein [Streptomyces platensis]WUB81340.1 RDD family protein [Streptomyces platensis]